MRRSLAVSVVLSVVLALVAPAGAAYAATCNEQWFTTWTLEFPRGYWAEGDHTYQIEGRIGTELFVFPEQSFSSDPAAPLIPGQVRLHPLSRQSSIGPVSSINPAQDTVLVVFQRTGEGVSRAEAEAFFADSELRVSWDGGDWVDVGRTPALSVCWFEKAELFFRSWGPSYSD